MIKTLKQLDEKGVNIKLLFDPESKEFICDFNNKITKGAYLSISKFITVKLDTMVRNREISTIEAMTLFINFNNIPIEDKEAESYIPKIIDGEDAEQQGVIWKGIQCEGE